MAKKFIRQDSSTASRLGKRRKNILKWRRPKGKHSKMREKRKSYPKRVQIGFKSPKKESGRINNLIPIPVNNQKDLQKITKENIIILSSTLGARKKIEIIKKAEESGLKLLNVSKGEHKK